MFFIFIYVAVWISLALASTSRLVYLFSSLSYSVVQKDRKIGPSDQPDSISETCGVIIGGVIVTLPDFIVTRTERKKSKQI